MTSSEIFEIVISTRTLKHRKAGGEHLSSVETDRVVRVARILVLAESIFGRRETALLWLRSSDERIGDRAAISMLHTESGGRLVENMLRQLDEGAYI